MNPTNIEWVISPDGSKGYTWNPIVGCKNNCWYCYARELATTRFAKMPGKCPKCAAFQPHFHPERLKIPGGKPKTIFFGSMADAWGDWVEAKWIEKCLAVMRKYPKHTFLALTKNPEKYGDFPIPKNLACGVTITGREEEPRIALLDLITGVPRMVEDRTRFISFEPLLTDVVESAAFEDFAEFFDRMSAIIIGPLNKAGHDPVTKREWVERIIEIAQAAGVPIFLKDACTKIGYTIDEMHERNLRQLPWVASRH